eukprot:SAG22_NODE_5607_length_985_cov_1.296840_2_plen_86_part_00
MWQQRWFVLTPDATLAWFKHTPARTLFDEMDEDGSGFLDQAEVTKLCKQMGKKLNKKGLEAAMKEMDADGSGEVEFEEFDAWWSK